jgi:hypothetical protein
MKLLIFGKYEHFVMSVLWLMILCYLVVYGLISLCGSMSVSILCLSHNVILSHGQLSLVRITLLAIPYELNIWHLKHHLDISSLGI